MHLDIPELKPNNSRKAVFTLMFEKSLLLDILKCKLEIFLKSTCTCVCTDYDFELTFKYIIRILCTMVKTIKKNLPKTGKLKLSSTCQLGFNVLYVYF